VQSETVLQLTAMDCRISRAWLSCIGLKAIKV